MSWFMCWLALTLNIYTEAGGEGHHGMQMVADTVITRTTHKDYPNDAYHVVLQNKQFSWTSRIRSKTPKGLVAYQKKLLKSKRMSNPDERESFVDAGKIAYRALQPNYKPRYKYTHFYSGTDKPKWAKSKRAVKYKNHYFME